jgi:hypothetical protein
VQLIAEGSSKLASVPSGGAGAAPAAGGAGAGGAAAEAPKEEAKEEGMHSSIPQQRATVILTRHREGGVRRRHGLRSLRLSVPFPNQKSTTRCGIFRGGSQGAFGQIGGVFYVSIASAWKLELFGLQGLVIDVPLAAARQIGQPRLLGTLAHFVMLAKMFMVL